MKKQPRKSFILLLSMLLPMGLMTAAFALSGITPFGSRSLGVLDMSDQYLAILASLRDVLSGKASPLYLPSLAMGGDMLGVAAYYLMSPLNLITCLFSKQDLLMGVGLLYILRVGLCGLTMAYYAGKRHGWGWRVVLAALGYSCMSFMTAYSINYLWQDCLVLLPLIALGISRVAEGRGHWLYTVSLAGALAMNFYMGYILCIFSVLFFLLELFTGPGTRRCRALVRFSLSSLAAGALSAVVLIPAFMVILGGKASFSPSALSLGTKFPLPEMLAKLFPGAFDYDQLTPAGLPNIFTGSVVGAVAVLYFANERIPRARRIGTGLLLAALALSFWVSALDLVWHGMNVPVWYNHRYSFLVSFLAAAAADRELAQLREGTRPWHLLLPVGAAALCAVAAFAGRSYTFISWPAGAWTVGVSALVSLALWLILRPAGAGRRLTAGIAAALLAVHMVDLGANAKRTFDELTVTSYDPAKWRSYVTEKEAAFARVDTGGELVRVESPEMLGSDRCEPMLFGYDGLSHFSSTIPVKNLDFLQRVGVSRFKDLFVLYGPDVTMGTDVLLGVRYLVASALNKPYAPVAEAGAYTVYENAAALPAGWTADAAVEAPVDAEDCFAYLQALYAAAAPEVDRSVYVPAAVDSVTAEAAAALEDGRYVPDGSGFGTLTYALTAQADGPLYAQIRIPDYPGVMVYVNGEYLAYYATGHADGSLYLGQFAAGESVSVQVQFAAEITISGAAFATEDRQALQAYSDAIAAGGCRLERLSGRHFSGRFTTGEGDGVLVLTIPWDEGWRIWLDGQPVQARQIQDCLTAISVTEGDHTLEMRYTPSGLIPGACISAGSLAVCLAVWLWERRRRRA